MVRANFLHILQQGIERTAREIVAVNDALGDAPEAINSDPYGEGWLVKVKLSDLYPGLVPFIVASIVGLLLVTYVPVITLWFPKVML